MHATSSQMNKGFKKWVQSHLYLCVCIYVWGCANLCVSVLLIHIVLCWFWSSTLWIYVLNLGISNLVNDVALYETLLSVFVRVEHYMGLNILNSRLILLSALSYPKKILTYHDAHIINWTRLQSRQKSLWRIVENVAQWKVRNTHIHERKIVQHRIPVQRRRSIVNLFSNVSRKPTFLKVNGMSCFTFWKFHVSDTSM